jgi:hypothetical protein
MTDNKKLSSGIRDGLIVILLSGILCWLAGGNWISIPVLILFGSLAFIGLLMVIHGVVTQRGDDKDGKHPIQSVWQKIRARAKPADDNAEPEIPPAPMLIWFFGIFLGPAIGWLLTSNAIASMTWSNWKYFLITRVLLSMPIPILGGAYIILRYLLPRGRWITALFFASISFIGFASGKASLADLLAREPTEVTTVIEAYRKKGYLRAPWLTSAYNLDFGSYTARLRNGELADFYCTPICLDLDDKGKKTYLLRVPVKVTYLKHLNEILEIERP